MPNIVFLDSETLNHDDISWEPISSLGEFKTYNQCLPHEILEKGGDADIIITNKVRFSEKEFSKLPKLKLLCVAATGYDVIDVEAARRSGVLVCNCAGYGTGAVAQMTVALLLEVCNHVGHYVHVVTKEKKWCDSPVFSCWDRPLIELSGRKAAIVGYGNIGEAVGSLLYAFGMEVLAVSSKSEADLPDFVKKTTLQEAFQKCDVVSLNCPLTANNQKMINRQLLSNTRKGLILLNTARGGLVDETAVCEALENGTLCAYCTDVLGIEPPSHDNKLLSAPNAYVTPHVAWATIEARKKLVEMLGSNIRAFLGGHPVNVVS